MSVLSIIRLWIFQIISVIFVVVYVLGMLNIHFSDKNNYCIMTYMYEYPQFVVSSSFILSVTTKNLLYIFNKSRLFSAFQYQKIKSSRNMDYMLIVKAD